MDMEQYQDNIERLHTITGFPSHWEQLKKTIEERDLLLRQVDELRAEVARLSQIAKY
jgi:hypothetical protein